MGTPIKGFPMTLAKDSERNYITKQKGEPKPRGFPILFRQIDLPVWYFCRYEKIPQPKLRDSFCAD